MNDKQDKLTAQELRASQQQIQLLEMLRKFNKNGNQSENILYRKINKVEYWQRLSNVSKTRSPLTENAESNADKQVDIPPSIQPPLGEC
jgi:hypothetical protein